VPPREGSAALIEQQAADWLARQASGGWSADDQVRLDQWLETSTAHKVAFLRLEAAWSQANRLQALGVGSRPERRPTERAPSSKPPRRSIWSRYRVVSLAAAVMLVIMLGALEYARLPGGSSFRTAVGATSAIPMSDGSQVTLNTDSQVRISVTGQERRVSLGRGEAFFDVAKDPQRPFVVVAGHCRVIAVGTQFSVWREANEVRVVVTEGRVRVERNDAPEPTTEVDAGSIAHAGDAGVLVEHKRLGEVEETLGWRRGFLFFHDLPLGEAVAEFNRYNGARIVIDSPDIAGIRISGSFRSTNVSGFVHLLRDGFSINVEQRGEQLILTGGG
jgi:transmembrane sensor